MSVGSFKIKKSANLDPQTTTVVTQEGDIAFRDDIKQLEVSNGSSAENITTNTNTQTLSAKSIDAGTNTLTNITNASISASAAIAYSKLSLSNSIVNADINASAAITYGKLALSNSVVNADIAAGAAIVDTKLATISTAGKVSNSATTADSNNTASAIVARDGSGNFSAGTITANLTGNASGTAANVTGVVAANHGGTGVANNAAATLTLSGANPVSLTTSGSTSITLPTSGTVATLAGTETLTNKTLGDAVTLTQIATPSTPSAGFDKLYSKSDDNLYLLTSSGAERLVGAGSSGGGINFVGLNATGVPTSTTDRDAEISVGQWASFRDTTPGPVPTSGMTGGSALSTSVSRVTNSYAILDGAASFLLFKGSASYQGEGISIPVYIPLGYRSSKLNFQANFYLNAGTILTQGDLKIFAWDVTNNKLITPLNNDVIAQNGQINAIFEVSATTAQIHIGFFIASTTTQSFYISFDDVSVAPVVSAIGMAGNDWNQNLVFTPNNFGSVTSTSYFTRRIGDSLHIRGYFKSGTTASAAGSISLPSGYVIDTTKVVVGGNQTQVLGKYQRIVTSNTPATSLTTSTYSGPLFYNGVNTDKLFLSFENASDNLNIDNANSFLASGDGLEFDAIIPIAGWTSNVQMASSSQFSISSYLSNGTRVTGTAPTQLGQYRSQLRAGGTVGTFSDSNGTPTITPSIANGISLYSGATITSGDSNNQPSRYDIFVGKNKSVTWQFFKSAGKTGFASVDVLKDNSGGEVIGSLYDYDPTTGIAWIQVFARGPASNNVSVGMDDGPSTLSQLYFDIIVSENALIVGADAKIMAAYSAAAAQSIPNSTETPVDFDTADIASPYFTTGVGTSKFTAPRTMKALVSSLFTFTGLNPSVGTNLKLSVSINGSIYKRLAVHFEEATPGTNIEPALGGSILVPLNAGDILRISVVHNFGATYSSVGDAQDTWVSISEQ